MNIIFLYDHLPYSNASSGGIVYVFNFIKYFSLKHNIFLVCLSEEVFLKHKPEINKYCKEVIVIKKRKTKLINLIRFIIKLHHKTPIFIEKSYYEKLNREFKRILNSYQIDLICCERILMFSYIKHNKDLLKEIKIYLREDTILYEQLREDVVFNFKELIKEYFKIPKYFRDKTKNKIDLIIKISNFLNSLQFRKVKKFQIESWKNIDLLTATNKKESKLIESYYKKKVKIVPNVLDFSNIKELNEKRENNTLIFLGNYSYSPNYQGVMFFLKKVFPRLISRNKEIVVYIIGPHPTKTMLSYGKKYPKNIKILGWVEDIFDFLYKKSIFIASLFSGSGQRIKLLQALYAKIPIITTQLCINEFYIKPKLNEEIIMANTPKEFVEAIETLLKDEYLRSYIPQNGFKFLIKNYNWEVIFKKLENKFNNLIENLDLK